MAVQGQIRMVEVGPRDGLQNEAAEVPTAIKVELIQRLAETGIRTVESTAFVRPDRVPQMADAAEVLAALERRKGVRYPVLVPNMKGLERAIAGQADEIAVFTAASETFNRRNTNISIDGSLERFEPVLAAAKAAGLPVRGYVSCALGCPYEGEVDPSDVARVAAALENMGCYEVSLGDTIGAGTPFAARSMLERVASDVAISKLALHFHDTRGQALANIYACLDTGIGVIDASVAGLGGCPYAEGATGNVASEDVIHMLHGMGIDTGINLERLIDIGVWISEVLDRAPASKLGQIAWRKR